MALDDILVPVVNSRILGEVGTAIKLHLQIEHGQGKIPALDIERANSFCLRSIRAILENPRIYLKRKYNMGAEDVTFFQTLLEKAENCDWTDSNQLQELSSYIRDYYP